MNGIPFISLEFQHHRIRSALSEAISKTIDRSQFILGESVAAFEREFSHYTRVRHCVGVANGLDALYIAMRAVGIGPGDEVIVPSHTCFATWLAVSRTGATPVPVEVSAINFTIDPALVPVAITPKTKAIVPVHLYGHPCRMDEIMDIAGKHHLSVIEDNAQAHGALFKGKKTGAWGTVNATSFYPTKNLGALGDGGAITTEDDTLDQFAKTCRNYGSIEKDVFPIAEGINSRLDELQAAVLLVKLQHLDEWNEKRKENAARYNHLLNGCGDLILPPTADATATPVYHLYVIRTEHRDALKAHVEKNGIGTAIHYPLPVHLQQAYQKPGLKRGALPVAERLSETILSLPNWPGLTKAQIDWVCEKIKGFFDHHL